YYRDGMVLRSESMPNAAPAPREVNQVKMTAAKVVKDEEVMADSVSFDMKTGKIPDDKIQTAGGPVQIRKNFNETAFFFPELRTDAEGNIEFSFTMPEALTQWKLMTLAHTKDLATVYSTKTTVTQKPLMVQSNAPRFMREGDHMEFSAKIVNLTDKEVTGIATLQLLDAATNKPVDGWFKNVFPNQYFTVAAGQSEAVKFPMEIPFNFNSAMTYRIVAKAGDNSDGEEMAIPILTNRMLVTESMPINMRNQTTKTFRFDKLLNSGNSTTITNHALTVEYTSNPAWYAVQALPYLMDYPYECAEQTFNRYYANTLASFISRSMPKIKTVFDRWKNLDTSALMSNLEKNQELKSALLEETPWVLDAQNEAQQKKNIALLFDMVHMSAEQTKAFNKLKEMQSSNGGFVWFKGGRDDRYMTQYIATGIGHLRKLNALAGDNYQSIKTIIDKAIPYLDKKIKEDYDNLIKYKAKLSNNNLSSIQIQYLYMRSFFPEYKIAVASQTAYNYYTGQAKKFWLSNSKYMQAMIALALHRNNDAATPKAIIRSLKENSINKEELGMYWKEWTTGGYYWHQAPIESQAMMIEAFMDIDKNMATVDDLKTWLLKQKQTRNWKTTKATAEACYALLLSPPTPQGGNNTGSWLNQENEVTLTLGSTIINSADNKTEAGTGYFKKRIEAEKVKPDMGNIIVSVKSADSKSPPSGGWGAVYWQYFEDLDKITPSATPLKLVKKLFIEKNSDKGPVLVALADGARLKVGDKVKVRIELKVDRDMEYIHMKDMRAACMEPTNVISEYKYQGGLGYYESTKDASTNFFFGWLARGSYVFEYPMFVTHTGNFSNGITSIQCMYAPEFNAHSEGIRVTVE
ncbi:MAG: alpha-2-macroglobulin family protein, partial [Ferruginibacter sp.]